MHHTRWVVKVNTIPCVCRRNVWEPDEGEVSENRLYTQKIGHNDHKRPILNPFGVSTIFLKVDNVESVRNPKTGTKVIFQNADTAARLQDPRSLSSKGVNDPLPETLEAISKALGFPKEFFYGKDIDTLPVEAVSFRSLTSMTARERDAALSAGSIAA